MSVNIHVNWKQHKRFFKLFIILEILYNTATHSSFPIICRIIGIPSMALLTLLRYSYIVVFRTTYIVQYILACFVVQTRFCRLNNSIGNENFAFKSRDVVKIGQLYHKLCDSVDILNETFTFHFIMIFTNALVRKTKFKKHSLEIIFFS